MSVTLTLEVLACNVCMPIQRTKLIQLKCKHGKPSRKMKRGGGGLLGYKFKTPPIIIKVKVHFR